MTSGIENDLIPVSEGDISNEAIQCELTARNIVDQPDVSLLTLLSRRRENPATIPVLDIEKVTKMGRNTIPGAIGRIRGRTGVILVNSGEHVFLRSGADRLLPKDPIAPVLSAMERARRLHRSRRGATNLKKVPLNPSKFQLPDSYPFLDKNYPIDPAAVEVASRQAFFVGVLEQLQRLDQEAGALLGIDLPTLLEKIEYGNPKTTMCVHEWKQKITNSFNAFYWRMAGLLREIDLLNAAYSQGTTEQSPFEETPCPRIDLRKPNDLESHLTTFIQAIREFEGFDQPAIVDGIQNPGLTWATQLRDPVARVSSRIHTLMQEGGILPIINVTLNPPSS